MKLNQFIENFICENTIIRLWIPHEGGHKMICKQDKEVCMEWELLKNKVWQSKYKDYKVIGVTDILTETYKEAINIVIKS